MAYHGGAAHLTGGFLGVDAFFVLSGFLITTLLISEWRRRGGIGLVSFWSRRARRLLPALAVVLVVVTVFVRWFVTSGTYPGFGGDVLYTVLYSANWHFIAAGANYFTATGPVSPLTHMWSLSVEEQFYVIWPLVVLGVLAVTRQVRAVLVVSVAGALASAVEMAVLASNGVSQTRLYYGTDTHAQSMLVGAALAAALAMVGSAQVARDPSFDRRLAIRPAPGREAGWVAANPTSEWVLFGVGAVCVAVSGVAWVFAGEFQGLLYHGGFFVAALAAAGVILSVVCSQRSPIGLVLASPPLRGLGIISYGLYLWHFPLFLWLDHGRTGLTGWSLFGLRTAVCLVVATASYVLVERPVRSAFRPSLGGRLGYRPLTAGVLAVVVLLALAVLVPRGAGVAADATAAAAPSAGVGAGADAPFVVVPSTTPAPGQPHDTPVTVPDNTSPMLLVGDSMAETLGWGIGAGVGDDYGLAVIDAGQPDCILTAGEFRVKSAAPQQAGFPCQVTSTSGGWPAYWAGLVARYHPRVSVFLGRMDIMDHLFDGRWTHVGDPAFDAYLLSQMERAITVLSAGGGQVALLTSPYYDSGEQADGSPWVEDDPARVATYNSLLRKAAAAFPGTATVIDLNRIADPDGRFTFTVGPCSCAPPTASTGPIRVTGGWPPGCSR